MTVVTTTIDRASNTGQQHTVTTRANGEVAEDTTTQGTGTLRTGTDRRPGDVGPVFKPNPGSNKEGDGSGYGSDGKKDDDATRTTRAALAATKETAAARRPQRRMTAPGTTTPAGIRASVGSEATVGPSPCCPASPQPR